MITNMDKEKELKSEIINTGKKLYDLRLVAAKSGNLSARVEGDVILITASGTCLGQLKEEDILKVHLSDFASVSQKGLSSEFPLHSMIYKNFPVEKIIHCHPPLINAYYAVNNSLENITFESKLFLGEVPVISQNTPNIREPEKAIEALKLNNIIVIKNHGAVSIANKFDEAFYLIEELEETVKIAAIARLFAKKDCGIFEKELSKNLIENQKPCDMFSKEHISKIVDLLNQDEDFSSKAIEPELTTKVAIKMTAEKEVVYKFDFQKGKISKLEFDDDAPFVISGAPEVWKLVFEGKIDPFVASTQGKLKLKGDMAKLALWYAAFSRMFFLFRQIKIK
ncbi:MAG: class II aldolase/adducin family protein [Candidatus Omnitrophota bacterium]